MIFLSSLFVLCLTMIKSCLLIATRKDRASLNIANNLLRMFQWKEIQADSFSPLENKIIISKIPNNKFVILWIIDEPLLAFDKPNEKLTRLLGPQFHNNSISDILFLSKHVSTAGTASLTVHPIGIPYQEENSRSGGMPGRCSPPSNHIGALMRSVYTESKAKGLDKYFKITLEATHHGPYVEIPTCFVEIGSTEEEWANEEAGEIWSTCLGKHFSLSIKDFLDDSVSVDSQFEIFDSFLELPQESFEDEIPNTSKIAVICIGSGHYVPKLNDIVRKQLKII